jgi:threonylcarbamoyladenosine tRNA methylthiotransferase MtaB
MSATGSTRVRTAAITNLGCKVNQSEMEAAARLLRGRGVALVDDRTVADLYLVNTCTVTSTADQKSRQAVRRARRTNPDAEVVVTGCSVQVGAEAIAAADPAARLIGNDGKDGLLAVLGELAALSGRSPDDATIDRPMPTLSGVEVAGSAVAIDGVVDDRARLDRTRAFVKVQDGCSFHCTYCIIPRARGPERSLPPEAVIAEVRRAIGAGHREIVLTGINVGTYDGGASEPGPRGSHRWAALSLAGLVRRILDETSIERLRLSSIEPQHVDDELLDAWGSQTGRFLPHLHMPLQSGDDGVLRRMGRRYDSAAYAAVVERARAALPGLAVHADVIVGFPSEDEEAWRRSAAYVRSIGFAGLHVFRYSARAGTPATRMAGQVPEPVRRRRSDEMLAIAAVARASFAKARVGREASVLVEGRLSDGRWVGHAEDHLVVALAEEGGAPLANAIVRARVEAVDPDVPERAVGTILDVDPPRATTHPLLDVLEAAHVRAATRSRSVPLAVPLAVPFGGPHG